MITRIMGAIYGRCRQAYYTRRYSHFRKFYGIKSNFLFNGTDIRIYGDGKLTLGENSYMGSLSTISLSKGTEVKIGSNCQISHNVRMYTISADPNQDFTKEKIKLPKKGCITIGNGVWIGANVFINPGITVGNNAVIGANSVLTKDVPEKAIVGGVPAKLIRYKEI